MPTIPAALWLMAATLGAEAEPLLPPTQAPIIYTIDYQGPFFTDPAYIEQFKSAPPDLLHIGKALPITHLWGPIGLYLGENQYTGGPGHTLSWENIKLISPEAVEQRAENIRATLARYHGIGIREIVPYISYHAIAGDHEKRLGFWEFYDRWAEYERWAGPQPAHDPFDWLAVDWQGNFLAGSCGGYTPDYFAPLHRYRACINHPDWAQWQRRLVCMAAEVGYDGCFIDNAEPDPCCCRYCNEAFRRWLADNHRLDWVRRLTEGLDVSEFTLSAQTTPGELVRRWRLLRAAEYIGELRQAARAVNPHFTTYPNYFHIHGCLTMGAMCDRLMFESTFSPGLLSADKPPETNQLTIRVSNDEPQPQRYSHLHRLNDPVACAELEAVVFVPTDAQVGKPVKVEVRILSLGTTPTDNDFAEDFRVVFVDDQQGRQEDVSLQPDGVIGGPSPPRKSQRPPVTLRASWTPQQPGEYAVRLGFRYTDEGHGPQAINQTFVEPLLTAGLCVDQMAELLYTQHMSARAIYLAYEVMRSGWENVQELALAQMAAFSGGGGISGHGPPQAKYQRFFKRHPDLFAGWQPSASAAVLYSYWGPNLLSPQYAVSKTRLSSRLGAGHRPYVALVDATLPVKAELLDSFEVIYLESPAYELKPEQLEALRVYAQRRLLVLADKQVAINGRPAVELLGHQGVKIWNPAEPLLPTKAIAPADGLHKNVRFACYRKDDKLAVHAVNFNVCLLDDKRKVLEVEPVPLEVPLPADWRAARAKCYSPDAAEEGLAVKVVNGVAQLTLPTLRLYRIVLLERAD